MLVVPNLTWPILFGESHLHQTDALVDHGKKQVHFRHPNMNFIVQCRNDNPVKSFPFPSNNSTNSGSAQLTSQESGANITCLFTGVPGMNSVKHSRQLQKGFNLIPICLLISAYFLGTYVLNKNCWLEGLQVSPGINITSGPIDLRHASSHLNVSEPEFRVKPNCSPSRLLPPYEEPNYIGGFTIPESALDSVSQLSDVLPDFDHQIFHTNVMVHTTHNKASLPYNCQLGKLRLMTDNDKDEFEAAADHTAEQLSEGWYEFIQSIVSSANNKSLVCNAMSHNLKQWKNSDQNTEMVNAGLDSSILSPFLMEAENNFSDTNRDLSPTDPVTLDPYSEKYFQELVKALGLDTDDYTHVTPDIVDKFKQLLQRYPTAFYLPGSQLSMIKGLQHNIPANNDTPIYKLPYHKSPLELAAIKEEHKRMGITMYPGAQTTYQRSSADSMLALWLITRTLTLLLWVMDIPYHQLIIFWMRFVMANTLVN